MNLTRRSFLHMGGMMGVAAIVGGGRAAATFGKQRHRKGELGSGMTYVVPASAMNDPLAKITREMFEASINTKFTVSFKGAVLTDLVLIAVYDLDPPFVKSAPASTRQAFSLVFRSGAIDLPQNTYSMQNTKLGRFDLFIVPATRGTLNRHYEANINRVFP
jgi:hypothetical protein